MEARRHHTQNVVRRRFNANRPCGQRCDWAAADRAARPVALAVTSKRGIDATNAVWSRYLPRLSGWGSEYASRQLALRIGAGAGMAVRKAGLLRASASAHHHRRLDGTRMGPAEKPMFHLADVRTVKSSPTARRWVPLPSRCGNRQETDCYVHEGGKRDWDERHVNRVSSTLAR